MRSLLLVLWIAPALAACSVNRVTFTPEGPPADGPVLPTPDAEVPPAPDAEGLPAPADCHDGARNGDETATDCGGSCGPCADGSACNLRGDCSSQVCMNQLCLAASCLDEVKNGDETDLDCGGSCAPCGDGKACGDPRDCGSQVCANRQCAAATCTDRVANGVETDVDCGGGQCIPCAAGAACARDLDCAGVGVCDQRRCRPARSCAEIHQRRPAAGDGAYPIAPVGTGEPFSVLCDMTRDDGGWTLLLKASGAATLNFAASAWTDTVLLNPSDVTLAPGDAKYPSFVALPVTTLRGELDGFRYTQPFAGLTAQQIFVGPADFVSEFPTFNTGAPNWSAQPNCHSFGINLPFSTAARFGWSANQENDCITNDTGIGLGVNGRGAGYQCGSTLCSFGPVDAGGSGLLWGR